MSRPAQVYDIMQRLYGDATCEHFVVFVLNSQHHITSIVPITTGILDASLVHPREIFQAAILGNAAGLILAHNHPSGNPEPSREDREVTRVMQEAGKLLGIPLVDHVVAGATGYRSLSEEGAL